MSPFTPSAPPETPAGCHLAPDPCPSTAGIVQERAHRGRRRADALPLEEGERRSSGRRRLGPTARGPERACEREPSPPALLGRLRVREHLHGLARERARVLVPP